jgi:O-antigen ligase
VLQSSRRVSGGASQTSIAANVILAATILIVAWGCFAFGAVYAWAYTPLAIACGSVGLLGLLTGSRPVWSSGRLVLLPLLGIGIVALIQLVPLPVPVLQRISPGTVAFIERYDLTFALGADPQGDGRVRLLHAISVAPALTIRALALFGSALLFLSGLWRSLSRRMSGRLARGIVVVGCLLAVVGVAQKALLGDGSFDGMRIYGFWTPESLLTTPFGPFVNKNHFAGWMLMAVPLALALACAELEKGRSRLHGRGPRTFFIWLSEPDGGRMLLYGVAATLMTLSLLMTGSRSGLACLAAVVCGGAVRAARRLGARRALVPAAAALLLIVVGLQWAGPDAALRRFLNDTESVGLRLRIWRASADAVTHFAVFGTGLDTFGTAMMQYQPARTPLHYNEAHNDYVQLLVEGGLVAFVLLIAALFAAARAIRMRFRANDDGPAAYWVRAGATAGLIAIGLQALVEFSLQMPGNAALLVVLLAMALYVPAPLRRDEHSRRR